MNEEKYDFTPVAVDEVPEPNITRKVRIMSDETIQLLKDNPDQWFRVFTYEGHGFMKVHNTAQSSTAYWRSKLKARNNMDLTTRVRRSTPDKSVEVFAKLNTGVDNG